MSLNLLFVLCICSHFNMSANDLSLQIGIEHSSNDTAQTKASIVFVPVGAQADQVLLRSLGKYKTDYCAGNMTPPVCVVMFQCETHWPEQRALDGSAAYPAPRRPGQDPHEER